MFDIGWTELLIVAVVAIVVIGPKDLPRAMRLVGEWTTKMKRMARDFQNQFNEAMRETELDTVQRDLQAIGKIDPLKDVRNEVTRTQTEIRKGFDASAPAAKPTVAAVADAGVTPPAETPAPALGETPTSGASGTKS